MSSSCLPEVSSGSFMVLGLVFKSDSFQVNFWKWCDHSSAHGGPVFPASFVEETGLSIGGPWLPCPVAGSESFWKLALCPVLRSMATAAGGAEMVSQWLRVLRGAQNPRTCSTTFPPPESQDETRNSWEGLEHSKARNRTYIWKFFLLSDSFPRLLRAAVPNDWAPGASAPVRI